MLQYTSGQMNKKQGDGHMSIDPEFIFKMIRAKERINQTWNMKRN